MCRQKTETRPSDRHKKANTTPIKICAAAAMGNLFCPPEKEEPQIVDDPERVAEICRQLQANDDELSLLDVRKIRISVEQIENLTGGLASNTRLEKLRFGLNRLGEAGAISLKSGLMENRTTPLVQLSVYDNEIGDAGARAIAELLANNTSLPIEILCLEGNNISDDGAGAIAEVLWWQNRVKKIGLHENRIGDRGASAIAEAIKRNTSLEKIYLRDNRITDEGARALLDALENHNGTLQELSLGDNRIRTDIRKSIATILKENTYGTRDPRPTPIPVSAEPRDDLEACPNVPSCVVLTGGVAGGNLEGSVDASELSVEPSQENDRAIRFHQSSRDDFSNPQSRSENPARPPRHPWMPRVIFNNNLQELDGDNASNPALSQGQEHASSVGLYLSRDSTNPQAD